MQVGYNKLHGQKH